MNTSETDGPAPTDKKPADLTWRDVLPWEGRPSRGDKVLLGAMIAVPLFYLLLLPARPFLIAKAPILLEFVTGSKTSIGAAAAYASVGELPLWLVVVAGIIGMAKFDWIFWLAGRRWGARVLRTFANTPSQQRWVERLQNLPKWCLPLLVIVSRFPGVPGVVIWLLAGMNKMRLVVFLICDLIACAALTGVMVAAGYLAGERGVQLITTIDQYAVWVSIGLVVVLVGWQTIRENRRAARQG